MKKQNKNWFATWFDSPYYHVLYKNRDYKEAEFFITNLVNFLQPKKEDKILDLACGAGRHSIFLNGLGYQVTGVDLAANSIEEANKSKNKTLNFDVHDMREVYRENEFNFIFNLFTSFGYFESDADNIKMLQSVEKSLKPNGIFVLDFFNAKKVIANLVKTETKIVDGTTFHLKREVKNGHIIKHIDFKSDNKPYSYFEKVQAVHLEDFKRLFSNTNMEIIHTFGNFKLEKFEEEKSNRLILVVRKKRLSSESKI